MRRVEGGDGTAAAALDSCREPAEQPAFGAVRMDDIGPHPGNPPRHAKGGPEIGGADGTRHRQLDAQLSSGQGRDPFVLERSAGQRTQITPTAWPASFWPSEIGDVRKIRRRGAHDVNVKVFRQATGSMQLCREREVSGLNRLQRSEDCRTMARDSSKPSAGRVALVTAARAASRGDRRALAAGYRVSPRHRPRGPPLRPIRDRGGAARTSPTSSSPRSGRCRAVRAGQLRRHICAGGSSKSPICEGVDVNSRHHALCVAAKENRARRRDPQHRVQFSFSGAACARLRASKGGIAQLRNRWPRLGGGRHPRQAIPR